MKVYILHHGRALQLAANAFETRDKAQKGDLLTQALFANAFADHFLADGFAAGYIRMPRANAMTQI
jgi:hypothetical protein